MEKNTVIKNISASLFLQIITIISGFVVPKILLLSFGSDVYGLTTSITQFLNYISLLEGGLSGVIMAALYKPLLERDFKHISGIVKATEHFFRQIGLIYVVYVIIVAIGYPRIVDTHLPTGYVSTLTLVLAINLFVQYFFSLAYKLLLNADRKVYFVSMVQSVIVILNMLLVVGCVKIFKDIVIVKFISAMVFLIQPIMYTKFVKNNYDIDKKVPIDNTALKQRWDGFGQNLAYFIHTNTDVVILTIFASLSEVAVYAVYLLIANALKTLVISISSAIVPSMGNIIAQNDLQATNKAFSIYEFGIWFITTVLFVCGVILVVPFVMLYTSGIIDANYYQPLFGPIILIAEMVYCLRDPYVNVAYAAGHFKQTAKMAYAEAAINIFISIVLVRKYGLIGVSVGTIVSMAIRLLYHVIYLKNNILFRNIKIFTKKLICFGIASVVSILFCSVINISTETYIMWLLKAVIVFGITFGCICAVSVICFRNDLREIIGRALHKRKG